MSEDVFGGTVRVEIDVVGDTVFFPFRVGFSEKIFSDKLEVKYNFELDLPNRQICLLKMGVAAFLAQLFLCKDIIISGEIDKKLVLQFNRLLKLLYNIRNYEEDTDIIPAELWRRNSYVSLESKRQEKTCIDAQKRAINLVGGGKDSAAAAILLERNGFDIVNCHVAGLNISSSDSELNACKRLYRSLDIVRVKGLGDLIAEISSISRCLGKPPKYNYVPRGRDLLSVLFALPLVQRYDSRYISLGCERDLWKNNMDGEHGPIPMHDTQSELTVIEINKIIKCVMPGIHLFSPISGLHEIKILSWLLRNRPEVVSSMSSCFYGNWCGECSKCARYYLIQRFVGIQLIKFQNNPLQPLCDYLKQFVRSFIMSGIPYESEILFLLKTLPDIGVKLPSNQGKNSDAVTLVTNHSNDLFRTHLARLIPRGFRRRL